MEEERKPPRFYVKQRLLEVKELAGKLVVAADAALIDIASADEIRVRTWRCINCGYKYRFTAPKTIKTCGPCPECQRTEFLPAGER